MEDVLFLTELEEQMYCGGFATRWSIGVVFMLLLIVPGCGRSARDQADDAFKRGDEYLQADEYDKAIAEYDQAIRLDPAFADAYVSRAKAYFTKSRSLKQPELRDDEKKPNRQYLDQAVADLKRALEINPDDETSQSNLAMLELVRRSDDFYEAFDQVADIATGPTPHLTDADRLVAVGELNKAMAKYCDEALKLASESQSAWIYYKRGLAHQKKGDAEAALDDFSKAYVRALVFADRNPGMGRSEILEKVEMAKGDLYTQLGEAESAKLAYQSAEKYREMRRRHQVRELHKLCLEHISKGRRCLRDNELELALAQYDSAVQIALGLVKHDPNGRNTLSTAYSGRAAVYERMGEKEKSTADLMRSAEILISEEAEEAADKAYLDLMRSVESVADEMSVSTDADRREARQENAGSVGNQSTNEEDTTNANVREPSLRDD